MKKIQIQLTIFTLVLALAGGGCKKMIDEAHQNPNAPVRVPPEQLLPQIISSVAANFAGVGPLNDARFVGRYVQYFAWLNALDSWDRMAGALGATDNGGALWRQHYYDFGQNVNRMMDWAEEEGEPGFVGVGHALFAWSWLQLTDYHGEVILNDAFNTNLLTFNFDPEEQVYTHVRRQCHQALAALDRAGSGSARLAKGDEYFYGGDIAKWKKFTYAVLARSFHHLTNKSSYNADSVIRYCDLSMTTNADNAYVKFENTGISANANFFGPLRNNMGGYRQSAFVADLMAGRNPAFTGVEDPRAWYMLRGNLNNTIVGVPIAQGNVGVPGGVNNRPEGFWGQASAITAPPTTDANSRYIFRNGVPMPVITASEVLFMKAEAALRKGDRTTALAAYRQAISLNFDMLTAEYNTNVPADKVITPAMKDAFLANTAVVPAAADLTLSHIMLQKYIALYGWGTIETWVDMRRYHYTDLDPSTGQQVYRGFTPPVGDQLHPDNNGNLVYRVRYRWNSEYVWNFAQLQAMGADRLDWHTREVWFSKP